MKIDNTFNDRTDFEFDVARERLKLASGIDTNVDALVRQDTGEFLAAVSPKYSITTHKKANAFAEKLFERSGLNVNSGNIAVNKSGTRFMREFRLTDSSFIPGSVKSTARDYSGNTDTFIPTLLLRNSYDRSSALDFTFGAFRMVCCNGMILPSTIVKTLRFKHVEEPDFDYIASEIHEGLEQTVAGYKELYERLNSTPSNTYLDILIAKTVLSRRMALIVSEQTGGLIDFELDEEGNIQSAIGGSDVSAYALMNILTEYATHHSRRYARAVQLQQKLAKVFV